ncbi:MAG TPA: metallopeptidase TldD-related protein, partial [Candidatus Polarisedimenticolia bacterium]|nr:metallopeptidase TldD-related protein [Candidatus Polarisedimenticolia bacterium]
RQTLMHLALGVVAGEAGASVVVRRSRTARSCSAFSPALFGDETARLAVTSLEGRPPAGGVYPAVLAPSAAAEVLRLIARRLSPPGPPPGTPIGSRLLNVIDDGRLPGGIATAPFDGEGTPTRRTLVVSGGAACEMIHDLASAARAGAASTGNGVRASFRDAPRHMTTNLFIAPGSDSPADLLSSLGDGIWIQTLRPTPAVLSDETALVAIGAGRWVKQGRPGAPFSGALVTWPLADLLAGINGVGNDLTFGVAGSGLGAPSLLLQALELKAP